MSDPNINNGLMTKIWGPHFWNTIHSVAFGYPVDPTDEQKTNYKNFFISLQYVLPCGFCRNSYSGFLLNDETALTDAVLENRGSLTYWTWVLHNRVNRKLSVNYNTTYAQLVEKYESYRAKCDPLREGCISTLEHRAVAFCNEDEKEFHVIDYKYAVGLCRYAESRGVDFSNTPHLVDVCRTHEPLSEWTERNRKCCATIKQMRKNGMSNIETNDNNFNGLPTINELYLISNLCSTLTVTDLDGICNKIREFEKVEKKYKLVKI